MSIHGVDQAIAKLLSTTWLMRTPILLYRGGLGAGGRAEILIVEFTRPREG